MVERVIRTYQLRSRYQRLLDAGLIPLSQMAQLLGVSAGTVKIWYHAGIVSGQRYNNKEPSPLQPARTQPASPPPRTPAQHRPTCMNAT